MLAHPRDPQQLTTSIWQIKEPDLNLVSEVLQLTIPGKALQGVARLYKHLCPAAW